MNQNNFFEMKKNENNNNNNYKINQERAISRGNYTNVNNSFFGSEFAQDNFEPISKEIYIKGFGLIFLYFSVIIYSLLYMLTPEKKANLFFEGDLNPSSFNYSIFNESCNIYKLDAIRERMNTTILEVSRNFCYNNKNYSKNNLLIKIIYSQNPKIINKVVIINNYMSKEIDNGKKIYHYYKIKDFPFCLSFFNKDNEDIMNMNSDYLNDFFF